MGFLDIDNVTKAYGAVEVLHRVDISVEEGEFLVLVGPSGCGKSTLLNMIAGLEGITSGEIKIKDRVVNGVHPSKRNIAMVFQSYALYPNMTVGQNITFGLEMHGVPKEERDKAMHEVAELLQIEHLLPQARPAFGRSAAARRDGPGAGARTPTCSCSTSRCRTSTPSCASTCGPRSRSCTRSSAPPSST
jgi:ABC-type sugar transport system ATPase subunit